jgi:hypothetical protein
VRSISSASEDRFKVEWWTHTGGHEPWSGQIDFVDLLTVLSGSCRRRTWPQRLNEQISSSITIQYLYPSVPKTYRLYV